LGKLERKKTENRGGKNTLLSKKHLGKEQGDVRRSREREGEKKPGKNRGYREANIKTTEINMRPGVKRGEPLKLF